MEKASPSCSQFEERGSLTPASRSDATDSSPPQQRLEQRWHLSEGELTPENIRDIGQLLYLSILSEPLPELKAQLRRNSGAYAHHSRNAEGTSHLSGSVSNEPEDLPAKPYVELFARSKHFRMATLDRILTEAGEDLATTTMPHLERLRARLRSADPRLDKAIRAAMNVSSDGLNATILDHQRVIAAARDARLFFHETAQESFSEWGQRVNNQRYLWSNIGQSDP